MRNGSAFSEGSIIESVVDLISRLHFPVGVCFFFSLSACLVSVCESSKESRRSYSYSSGNAGIGIVRVAQAHPGRALYYFSLFVPRRRIRSREIQLVHDGEYIELS